MWLTKALMSAFITWTLVNTLKKAFKLYNLESMSRANHSAGGSSRSQTNSANSAVGENEPLIVSDDHAMDSFGYFSVDDSVLSELLEDEQLLHELYKSDSQALKELTRTRKLSLVNHNISHRSIKVASHDNLQKLLQKGKVTSDASGPEAGGGGGAGGIVMSRQSSTKSLRYQSAVDTEMRCVFDRPILSFTHSLTHSID